MAKKSPKSELEQELELPTILEQLKAEGEANMLAEKAETVLTVIRARFKKVSKAVEDKAVLDSLAAHAATCESLDEFEKHLP